MKLTIEDSSTRWVQWMAVSVLLCAALLSGQAAEVTQFGAFKLRNYEQSGPLPGSPPVASDFAAYGYALQSAADAVLVGTIDTGAVLPLILVPAEQDPLLLESSNPYSTQAELDGAVPNGNLGFTLFTGTGGQLAATLALAGNSYPPAPALDNFAAAQDIDATEDFTLTWTKPAQLGASDYVIVSIESDGDTVLESKKPWEAGALDGNTTTFKMPAGTLPADTELTASIVFVKVTVIDSQSIAGAVGKGGYAAETWFPLKLHGGGGGGDTTEPVLVSSVPAMGALGVAANTSVLFHFSEPMKPQQQINWIGVTTPASFVYNWSVDGTSLTCTYPGGFTAGAAVTWQLVPTGFSDLAGNALDSANIAGFFMVATGGGPGECEGGITDRKDSFLVGRFTAFHQTTAGPPTPAPGGVGEEPAASFISTVAPVQLTLSAAEVVVPGGERLSLSSVFGLFLYQKAFPAEADLNAAHADGIYSADLTLSGGSHAIVPLNLGAGPNLPHCANFTAAQAIDPAAEFILSWDALSGATANDFIEITIRDSQGKTVLQLPDECAIPPKHLAATATSVTLPANLLKPAQTYPVELNFFRVSEIKTNASPAFVAMAGNLRTTRFDIKTLGGTPNATPVITGYRIAPDGRFEMDVTGTVGRTINLDASDGITGWGTVGSGIVPASGSVTVRDSRLANLPVQAYRAKSE